MLTSAGTVEGYGVDDAEFAFADEDHIAWWKDMLAAAPNPFKDEDNDR